MSTTQRKRRTANLTSRRTASKRSRAASTPSQSVLSPIHVLDSSTMSSEDVVDLTCEAAEASVVDLTSNDSLIYEVSTSGPQVRLGEGCESYVLSSDEEEEVNVGSNASFLSSLEANSAARATPGTISCPVCLDTYGEIVGSGRLVVSTRCGHLFCSQCLRDSLAKSHSCPTCRKKLTNKQYHPIYI